MVRLSSSERSTILLLGCAKSKLTTPAAAKDLYWPSTMVRARRRFAEERGAPWFILRSKWGLLDPEQLVAPYEMYPAGR
ncbi:MAG TPA: hypothetical protein VGX23_26460 [Actinocrinis sp.]|nr:hypothetical protein [Actinocrinis sp.]